MLLLRLLTALAGLFPPLSFFIVGSYSSVIYGDNVHHIDKRKGFSNTIFVLIDKFLMLKRDAYRFTSTTSLQLIG
jgi:hypothetical protein